MCDDKFKLGNAKFNRNLRYKLTSAFNVFLNELLRIGMVNTRRRTNGSMANNASFLNDVVVHP